jgi:methionine-rich copper-binding protein CopC
LFKKFWVIIKNLSRELGIISMRREFLNDKKRFNTSKIMLFALVLVGMVLIFSNGMADVSAVSVGDTHKPTITAVDPANNAVCVSTSKVVKISFNKAVKKGNMFIEFKNSKGQAVKFTSNLTGKTLSIKPKSKLAHLTSYTVVLHSGCVKDMAGNGLARYSTKFTTIKPIKTYKANGVSFNYPSTYQVYVNNEEGNKYISGFRGYSQIAPSFQLSIFPNPAGMTDQDAIDSVYNMEFPSGFKIVSKQTYTLNGYKVYGMIYTINNKKYYPVIMQTKLMNIIKNHKTYTMEFTAPIKTFANEKTDFNIIAQSFKIL